MRCYFCQAKLQIQSNVNYSFCQLVVYNILNMHVLTFPLDVNSFQTSDVFQIVNSKIEKLPGIEISVPFALVV